MARLKQNDKKERIGLLIRSHYERFAPAWLEAVTFSEPQTYGAGTIGTSSACSPPLKGCFRSAFGTWHYWFRTRRRAVLESSPHRGRKESRADSGSPSHRRGSKSSPKIDEIKQKSKRRSRSKSPEGKRHTGDKYGSRYERSKKDLLPQRQ
ncbi:hypothetical protein HN51_027625 [Arachis hypogaea]